MSRAVVVVGIGADGWAGLGEGARREIRAAEVLMGGARQLALVPDTGAERVTWPSPMLPVAFGLIAEREGKAVCVLASGDPMLYGFGATLARTLGPGRVRVLPHLSSVSLACARMGWPVEDTQVVTLVGRPADLLTRALRPSARVLVLSAGAATPGEVARLLVARGYGRSPMTVLERLGAPEERLVEGIAATWDAAADALNVVALECRADPGVTAPPCVPGLPDDAFEHDGQLTKREVRAVTLSRLAPRPGERLWDVGAGAGSVAVEWMRAHPSCAATAVESRADRAERIGRNARALGVPGLRVVHGKAPEALEGLDPPDAIFIGGGTTAPGVLSSCWDALGPGGRLVVNAVTVESEAVLASWHARLGGDLLRLAVHRAGPVGGFTAWRPAMPVTIWTAVRP
ncbi:precorrin-6y C5,15-methyltransferase (decarboxylating) subunit CbiE [Sphaerisporangium krabiense]|uniref:Precorrin-6Y C5,15-methyltransferase (Decarboxylating) n=1 Tax=Sphaerisporangium krabiense TaxID=763782 RepID=A0A7W9DSD9_9ACTN|nr:precorrin-6y C5,15-methyltransferase (decarboxylating) subunit CbiE [Sphaerisporangium krabiense]MBB5628330.1 precorrin-6Y C5,15-methyltransferase (decarboxylating) [Sphaerisporangium krabiense]